VIVLSCGIKISAVYHLDLSQSTRVTDRQTDRITTHKTARTYARAVITKPWFRRLLLVWPGNSVGLFLQPWSPHGACLKCNRNYND